MFRCYQVFETIISAPPTRPLCHCSRPNTTACTSSQTTSIVLLQLATDLKPGLTPVGVAGNSPWVAKKKTDSLCSLYA